MIKKIGILTSGGDAPGMNAAVATILKYSNYKGIEVAIIFEGFKGMVENDIKPANYKDLNRKISSGGTAIYSARLPEFKNLETRKIAIENLKKNEIEAVIVIGGDGSYMGAKKLTEMGINCIGIPGTIDNDISSTDWTIGFDTALNTIVDQTTKIRDTMRSHSRVAIIEVMGRNCGDLTIFGALATGSEGAVTAENIWEVDDFVKCVNTASSYGKRSILILVSELIYGRDGRKSLEEIAKIVEKKTNKVTRVSVLGHSQRGGIPSAMDRVRATQMALHAVDLLIENKGGRVVGVNGGDVVDYEIIESFNLPKINRKKLINFNNKINIKR